MIGAQLWRHIRSGAVDYVQQVLKLNTNIRLLLLSSVLSGIAQGIFGVDFNLYILSIGIEPGALGKILSAGPFAHALAAIPIGFLGELLGYRVAFVAIYLVGGLSCLAQVSTENAYLISAAAFVGGLALSGNFVVRMPFLAANTEPSERTHVFSINSLFYSLTYAVGALFAGYLPNILRWVTTDQTTQYRYTLYLAGIGMVLSVVPILFIKSQGPRHHRKISLKPYLWGMDAFTVKSAGIELFIGLTLGLVLPFANLYFILHLGTSREFFGTAAALSVIPISILAALGPVLARRLGNGRAIVISRYLVPLSTVVMALAATRAVGTGGYWSYRALFNMSQALWFAYAMGAARESAKTALSAWLEITFWLGQALAALVTGSLLAGANFVLPLYLSSAAALITALLTQLFIRQRAKSQVAVVAVGEAA